MDTLTHIVLGACIGDAVAGKTLGRKAMVLGALVQSVPDLDFIAAFWLTTPENLLAHRGFTHSILFGVMVTLLLALLAVRWPRVHPLALQTWILFFSIEIFTHLFLDLFNAYGTGLFEPFSHERISFHTLYVADPFFSVWPAIALFILIAMHRLDKRRRYWWRFGIGLSAAYLLYCIANKIKIEGDTKAILAKQKILYNQYITTPTPLNNWLWYIVASNDSGQYVGYRSVFDKKDTISFQYFPKNAHLLHSVTDHESLQYLLRFSQGFYTVEQWGDTLVFNDLRFGQIVGWHNAKERFVFHYFLQHPDENHLVVQRGRFARWDKETLLALFRRIKGNP